MSSDIYQEIIDLLPKLRRFAYGLTRSKESAEDLVQEACARLLADLKEKESYFERWLFRTIRNIHIDQVRKNSVAERHQSHLVDHDTPYIDGSEVVETLITLDQAKSVLFELSEEHRTVLLLIGVEGFSYREAADILDLPVGTVTSRLARARNSVVQMVNGGSVNEGDLEVQRL
ncbi:MAG: RNA polymerase sigma factor [Candidatus Sedimenticola sp. (ex Thyasira tokunagai)]